MLVSDLHLGDGGPGEAFDRDEALCAFLCQLAGDRDVTGVVLLGDTFDLVEGSAPDRPIDATSRAVARLDDIAAAHPDVLAAMAALLRAGKDLTVVRGNHDVELVRPQVRVRLAGLLGVGEAAGAEAGEAGGAHGRAAGRLIFTPWLLHLPGMLLAEHGHQHHDINRFDRQMWPFPTSPTEAARPHAGAEAGPVQEPFGAALSRLRHEGSDRAGAGKIAGSVLRHGLRLQSPRRRRDGVHYRRSMLPGMNSELGVPLETAQRLDSVSERSAVQVLARVGRAMARARAGKRRPEDGYLPAAAAVVLRTLGPAAPPYLVYGHSHAADAIALGSGARSLAGSGLRPTTYLNTGTWCRRGPRPGDTTLTPAGSTWVEVSDDPGFPARVCSWTGDGPRLLAEVVDGAVFRS